MSCLESFVRQFKQRQSNIKPTTKRDQCSLGPEESRRSYENEKIIFQRISNTKAKECKGALATHSVLELRLESIRYIVRQRKRRTSQNIYQRMTRNDSLLSVADNMSLSQFAILITVTTQPVSYFALLLTNSRIIYF